MISKPDDLPSDLASALAALQAEREARLHAEAMAASALAELSDNEALIAYLELRIEKLKRELHGQRSERTARLIEQLELELEELITTASEDELAAQAAAVTQRKKFFIIISHYPLSIFCRSSSADRFRYFRPLARWISGA